MAASSAAVEEIAAEAVAVLETGHQIGPFSSRFPGFALEMLTVSPRPCSGCASREVIHPLGARLASPTARRGATTSRCAATSTTARSQELAGDRGYLSLAVQAEPRIEPEIVFGVAAARRQVWMSAALLGCVDAVDHGFEVVRSIFPRWACTHRCCSGLRRTRCPLARPLAYRRRSQGGVETGDVDLLCRAAVRTRRWLSWTASNVFRGLHTHGLAPPRRVAHTRSIRSNPPLAAGEMHHDRSTCTPGVPPVAPGERWTTKSWPRWPGRQGLRCVLPAQSETHSTYPTVRDHVFCRSRRSDVLRIGMSEFECRELSLSIQHASRPRHARHSSSAPTGVLGEASAGRFAWDRNARESQRLFPLAELACAARASAAADRSSSCRRISASTSIVKKLCIAAPVLLHHDSVNRTWQCR